MSSQTSYQSFLSFGYDVIGHFMYVVTERSELASVMCKVSVDEPDMMQEIAEI